MKIIFLKAFTALLILGACVPDEILKLASEYTGSVYFYEQAQKNLRLVYSQCEYKTECFQEDGMKHIKEDFCPRFKEYKFVSETECHRAGQGVLDLVSGKTHIAVPVNNPNQNAHNEQMLEIEKQRLELEKERAEREERKEERRDEREDFEEENERYDCTYEVTYEANRLMRGVSIMARNAKDAARKVRAQTAGGTDLRDVICVTSTI